VPGSERRLLETPEELWWDVSGLCRDDLEEVLVELLE